MIPDSYIGKILHGFCNGFFGRDSYDDKVVEAVGRDWIVARNENGIPMFACFHSWNVDICAMLDRWCKEEW